MKQLIAFDLDGTLAESKQPIDEITADLLAALLEVASVAVISGGDWPQFETQVVSRLPRTADLRRLFILPTTGTKLFRLDASWQNVYADDFSADEGHISSVTFRTGVCGPGGNVSIDPPSPRPIVLQTEAITSDASEPGVRIFCDGSHDLSEVVIFPTTPSQRNGIEDVRLVRFVDDDGTTTYFGTYTAFSGQAIRQELLRTPDFRTFDLLPLRGNATDSKGMALFPRRVDGKFAMIGRQDNENIWFLTSNDVYDWNGGVKTVSPRWPWEFVQMGNCGSPIEIDEGWLLITHGVGTVRNYCIGACLLDRKDPSKLLARVTQPLLRPDTAEREGYVPNVTYSCGAMVHGRTLVLPYAVADSFTSFATMPLDQLLAAME